MVGLDIHRLFTPLALVDVPDLGETEVDFLQHLERGNYSTYFLLLGDVGLGYLFC